MTLYLLRWSNQWNLLNEVCLLSKFDISCFFVTGADINFQIGYFADFEEFKIDSHFDYYGQVKIDPYSLFLPTLDRSQSFLLRLVKTLGCEKQSKPFPFDKKFKNQA